MQARSKILTSTTLLLMVLGMSGCKKNTATSPTTPEEPTNPYSKYSWGVTLSPAEPDMDKPLTITFNAEPTSPFSKSTDDLYIHIGIVENDGWLFVPAAWGENNAKNTMKRVADHIWQIELSPSMREWFGSGKTPASKLGIVIRNADGTTKAYDQDLLYTIIDSKAVHPAIVSSPVPLGMKEGINVNADGTVTLVLNDTDNQKASKYTNAYVIGDFNGWQRSNQYAMKRDAQKGLWWITLSGLDKAKEYGFQYYLFGTNGLVMRLADPYTEKIISPEDEYIPSTTYEHPTAYPSGKTTGIISTFVIGVQPFAWKSMGFVAPDPDDLIIYELHLRDYTTTHDIDGAIAKLDELKALGVNAIELMPTQEFSGNDSWGYNPIFYFAMDKSYGSKVDYQAFIDACHQRGMAVILDVVYNHMDLESPFFKLYSDNNNPAVNNPYFNTSAPHPYSVFFDLNHESPRTREMVKRNLQFLLKEYHLDGFRFDLSKGLTQTSSTEATAGRYDAKRIAILKDYNSAIKAVNPKAYTILEHFAETKEEKELAQAGMMLWRNLNNAYSQAGMGWAENSGFEYLHTGTDMPYGSLVGYMESHDEERVAFKQKEYGAGDIKTSLAARVERLKLNAAFFLTVPGPKMLWQYGEYGYDVSIEENGRTGRKPVWTTELSQAERKELAKTYKSILAIRKQNPELWNTGIPFSWNVQSNIWSTVRTISLGVGTKKMLVIGNFQTSAPASYTLSAPMKDGLTGQPVSAGTLELAPNTFRILLN